MSTERIFGSWDTPRQDVNHLDRELQLLWSHLAAQHVNTPQFEPNSGLSQRKAEITMLWQLFHLQRPKIVLEIGVAQGGTFAGWCKLAPADALLIGIDRCVDDCRPRPGDPVHPMISMFSNASTTNGGGMYHLAQGTQRVVPINGWSYEPHVMKQLLEVLSGRKIDFLMHDASHQKDMAARDYDIYRPLMAEGSMMAFHDIQRSAHPDCNKSEFWEWTKDNVEYSARFEFLGGTHDDSLGIGILIF